jgi:integrase/recombinase XerD
LTRPPVRPSGRPPAFFLEPFRDYLAIESGTAANTVENYLRDVQRLVAFLVGRGVPDPGGVTAELLREFLFHLKDVGLAASSIRREVSALRTYFRFLSGEGHIARDPSAQLETPKAWRKLPTVLAVSEIEALLGAPRADEPLAWRDRALLEVAYATGVRVSELVGLGVNDVLFEDGLVKVMGKGSKERLVPIGRRALGAAALYARETRPRLDKGHSERRFFPMPAGGRYPAWERGESSSAVPSARE